MRSAATLGIRNSHGFALVTTMVTALGLLCTLGGLVVLGQSTIRRSVSEEQRLRAFYAAESGINEALALLRQDPDSLARRDPQSYPDQPSLTRQDSLPGASYHVWIYPDAGATRILAKGLADSAGKGRIHTRVITAVLGSRSPFVAGAVITGKEGQTPAPVALPTLSCPSANEPLVASAEERLTDAELEFKSLTTASQGHVVLTAPGSQSVCINGSLSVANQGRLTIASHGTVELHVWGDLTLDNNTQLVIEAQSDVSIVVHGNVYLHNSSRIVDKGTRDASPSAWPTIYTAGGLIIENSAQVGSESSRPFLFLASADADSAVTMINSAIFYGGVYAPTREVTLDQNQTGFVKGSVVADTVTHEERVIYDDLLLQAMVPGFGGAYGRPLRWEVKL